MADESKKWTVRDVIEGAKAGDPEAIRRHEEFTAGVDELTRKIEAERQGFIDRLNAASREMQEQQRLAAEARARAEADRIEREQAIRDGIHSIRALAEEAARASAERERETAGREQHIVKMTGDLLKLTKTLVVLAALTLAAAIVTLIVAA